MSFDYKKFDLTGRVAVVTGGSSGIGRAIALGLAEAGADVVPLARGVERVAETMAAIRKLGRKTLRQPMSVDVTSRPALETVEIQIADEVGPTDILVTAAGILQRKPTLEVTDEEWSRILRTDLDGVFIACQVFGRGMVSRRCGSIINIASMSSLVSFEGTAAYTSAKGAIVALTRELGCEWARYHVRVNAIAPGVFKTPLNEKVIEQPDRKAKLGTRTPMGRYGQPEEMAGAAIFLASDAASFVTGVTLPVDGGFYAYGV
ncbi:MAG: glucose 1-dehydrogenase [Verrucomicrobia bacterium]|nr:glucose 1-dehydrogenase [Verrucomicrobiota bacterium]